ncbi:putative uncharacterized transposon-derived protein F52C9.6 [Varanus komodoensis]|nr:putative uncharacterized transposon-derived protein F52C9.6 [Varanus komodoensis]
MLAASDYPDMRPIPVKQAGKALSAEERKEEGICLEEHRKCLRAIQIRRCSERAHTVCSNSRTTREQTKVQRDEKGKGERYTQFNAEFQRIDKNAFLNEQCKEIEENNRIRRTRDLFKKIGDMKGTFHAKMGMIKDQNGRDLTEAEEIKKRWQDYTEELLPSFYRPHEHIMRKGELDESPVGIKIARRNINNLRDADDTTLMAESEEDLKSLLMRVKEESAKVGLKLNIKKTKIMASGPLTSWQIDGEEMEVVTDFIFLGSKITTDRDCSQEIKTLAPWEESYGKSRQHTKSRDNTLPTKVCIVKAMVFAVAVYGCESWIIRKAKSQRIEAFELWCWRRLLRVPWTERSNQSDLEINPDCSLEGQILKMKLKFFGHLMRRKDSLEKSLMLGTIDGKRRRGRQRMSQKNFVTYFAHTTFVVHVDTFRGTKPELGGGGAAKQGEVGAFLLERGRQREPRAHPERGARRSRSAFDTGVKQ